MEHLCDPGSSSIKAEQGKKHETNIASIERPNPVAPSAALAAPPAAYGLVVDAGAKKGAMPANKIFLLGILGGAYIALGALLMLSAGGNCPGLAAHNPGARAALMGLMGLPCGLLMVLVTGAELFTGNTALLTAAVLERRISVGNLAKSWAASLAGNTVGSLLVAALAVASGLFANNGAAVAATMAKTSMPWLQAFFRGILCNWLVCLAIYMAAASSTLPGKALAVIFPISAFVAIGTEHSVANLFILPAGIWSGAQVPWSTAVLGNIVPVLLGNIVAGVVLVAMAHSMAFGCLLKPNRGKTPASS